MSEATEPAPIYGGVRSVHVVVSFHDGRTVEGAGPTLRGAVANLHEHVERAVEAASEVAVRIRAAADTDAELDIG
jgi:hypothetical protein